MSTHCVIYVYLPEEAVDVWRPVQAEAVGRSRFRIVPQAYDRDDEVWQFEPGEVVECEIRTLEGGPVLVAVCRAAQT